MNEFQLTLTNITARRATSVAELAKRVGYEPFLFGKIVAGKTCQVPVDFFIRITDTLNLSTVEKDELVRSWAFGIERWTWSLNIESGPRRPASKRAAG